MGDIPQILTSVDIETLHAETPSTAIRVHSISDCLLRSGNMGIQQRTRKNDSIDATQDATTHHPDKKGYKKIEKHDFGTKEENEEIDINDMRSTDDESGDCQSTTTHNDVDSEVSFQDDADDEIETTLIEEEDWIEYIKRSTVDAMEKMECAKIRCWNRIHKKMKWKLAMRIATSPSDRWLKKAAEWNPELSSRCRTNRAIGRPRKRWEDDINEFLKQESEENENPIESSNQTNKTRINNDRVRTTEVKDEDTANITKSKRNEMMTTGDAAAPQPRFASINKMTHLKAAADLHSRTSRWVDV